MIVLGIDAGLASCGYGVVESSRRASARVLEVGVITTAANPAIDQRTDRARRIATVSRELRRVAERHGPTMVAAEQALGHGNINAVMPQVLCWGAVAALATEADVDLAEVTAKEWQHDVMGLGERGKVDYDKLAKRVAAFIGAPLLAIEPKQRTHAIDGVGIALYAALRPVTLVWRGAIRRARNATLHVEHGATA